jgi:AcrR family transcriptional regulator
MTRLLETEGIKSLSVDRIARAAGVSRPSFYVYFDTKYSALLAAVANIWSEIGTVGTTLTWQPENESFEAAVRRGVDLAISTWQRQEALLVACVQAMENDARIREFWGALQDGWVETFAPLVDRWREAGLIAPVSDDTPALLRHLVGMGMRGCYDLCCRDATVEEFSSSAAVMTAIVVGCLAGPELR